MNESAQLLNTFVSSNDPDKKVTAERREDKKFQRWKRIH